jgi:chromosomal replication initiation ATPase DnaA
MSYSDPAYRILGEAFKTVESIGASKLLQLMQDAQENHKKYNKEVANFIVETCCEKFSVIKNELVGGSTKGNRVYALMFCFVLFKSYLSMQDSEIGFYFNKDRTRVYRLIKKYYSLDKKIRSESDLIYDFEQIDQRVKDFINKIKKK